jgi:hypothetical protein
LPARERELGVLLLLALQDRLLLEADEHLEVVPQQLRRPCDRVGREDALVGPHLQGQLVVVDALAEPGRLDVVVHLRDRRE